MTGSTACTIMQCWQGYPASKARNRRHSQRKLASTRRNTLLHLRLPSSSAHCCAALNDDGLDLSIAHTLIHTHSHTTHTYTHKLCDLLDGSLAGCHVVIDNGSRGCQRGIRQTEHRGVEVTLASCRHQKSGGK